MELPKQIIKSDRRFAIELETMPISELKKRMNKKYFIDYINESARKSESMSYVKNVIMARLFGELLDIF